jgi:hypothetical protein
MLAFTPNRLVRRSFLRVSTLGVGGQLPLWNPAHEAVHPRR